MQTVKNRILKLILLIIFHMTLGRTPDERISFLVLKKTDAEYVTNFRNKISGLLLNNSSSIKKMIQEWDSIVESNPPETSYINYLNSKVIDRDFIVDRINMGYANFSDDTKMYIKNMDSILYQQSIGEKQTNVLNEFTRLNAYCFRYSFYKDILLVNNNFWYQPTLPRVYFSDEYVDELLVWSESFKEIRFADSDVVRSYDPYGEVDINTNSYTLTDESFNSLESFVSYVDAQCESLIEENIAMKELINSARKNDAVLVVYLDF